MKHCGDLKCEPCNMESRAADRSDLLACQMVDVQTDGESIAEYPCKNVARFVTLDGYLRCAECAAQSQDTETLIDIDSPQGHRVLAAANAPAGVPS